MLRMCSAVIVDEVHCLWPSCSHSCCWESEQRIRDGQPRTVLKTETKRNQPVTRPSCTVCRIPVFTLVDAKNWIEEDFISWMALPKETLSQKPPHHNPPAQTIQMHLNQDKKTRKTGVVEVTHQKHSMQAFPPEDWLSPRSDVETERCSSTTDTSSRSSTDRRATDSAKDLRLKYRAFKKTDIRLLRRIFHSPRRPDLNDQELCIRGITPPRNSSQSSLASSTVELNQQHLEL